MRFPFLPEEEIHHAAAMLLVRGLGISEESEPFVDLDGLIYDYLCEAEGLSFDDEKPLPPADGEEVLGKIIARPGKILIHGPLKAERSVGRYRFTVAHELGHWVLHRPIMLAEVQQLSLLESGPHSELVSLNRSIFAPESKTSSLPPEEWQANRFAAALLVPPALLKREFRSRFGDQPAVWDPRDTRVPSFRFFAREIAGERVRRKSSLADAFGLSVEAMAITLQERGFVTRG